MELLSYNFGGNLHKDVVFIQTGRYKEGYVTKIGSFNIRTVRQLNILKTYGISKTKQEAIKLHKEACSNGSS